MFLINNPPYEKDTEKSNYNCEIELSGFFPTS